MADTVFVPAVYSNKMINWIRDVQIVSGDVGIYNAGTITTIDGDTSIAAGTSSSTGLAAIIQKANASIGTIGSSGSTVTTSTSDKALWLEGSSTKITGTIGEACARVELSSSGANAILNPGTTGELADGLIAVFTSASNFDLVNTGTVTLCGGDYHASGNTTVIGGEVTYDPGNGLSTDTRTTTLVDGITQYECYYIKEVKVPGTASGIVDSPGAEPSGKFATLAEAIESYLNLSNSDRKGKYSIRYENTTESTGI